MTKLRNILTSLALLGALGAATPALSQTKVAVAYTATIDVAPLFVATDKGMFVKRGIEVTPQLIQVNSLIPPALVSNSVQIGMPTASTFLQAVDGGLDLTVVSGLNFTRKDDKNFGIIARTGTNIAKAQDLVGKKMGVPGLNAFLHVLGREWLRANGVDPKQVTYVETAFPQMNEIMKSGNVDAVIGAEPFQSRIIKAGNGTMIAYLTSQLPENLPIVFFASTRKWADANPQAAKAFKDGMAEGMEYTLAHLDEARAITAKYLKLPLEIVASIEMPKFGVDVKPDSLASWLKIMKSQDMITGSVAVDKLVK
jgi:NitT/TauT family transport system substrate-binding protein